LGNHDAAAAGILVDLAYFNTFARDAALWTRKTLTEGEREFLRTLPLVLRDRDFVVVHGSLDRPHEFNYIQTARDAERSLMSLESSVCFVGHSHVAASFFMKSADPRRIEYSFDEDVDLSGFDRALINVGSVGQPRDEDPRSVAAIFDEDTRRLSLRRV